MDCVHVQAQVQAQVQLQVVRVMQMKLHSLLYAPVPIVPIVPIVQIVLSVQPVLLPLQLSLRWQPVAARARRALEPRESSPCWGQTQSSGSPRRTVLHR